MVCLKELELRVQKPCGESCTCHLVVNVPWASASSEPQFPAKLLRGIHEIMFIKCLVYHFLACLSYSGNGYYFCS